MLGLLACSEAYEFGQCVSEHPIFEHTVFEDPAVRAGSWVLLVAVVTLPSQLPYPIIVCALYCKHQIVYGFSLSDCLRLRFLDVETNPGPRLPVPAVCRILCSNVRGLAAKLSDLTVASSQYDILLCSETLVSDMRHVSEVLVPAAVLCRGKMPRARGMAAYVRDVCDYILIYVIAICI